MKVKKFLKPILCLPFGLRSTQWFFEKMRRAALMGLNVGCGGRVAESGEKGVLHYVKTRAGANKLCIFDVGANVGDWSEGALKVFDQAEIYAFEPSLATFERLDERLKPYPRAHLFNLGLGDKIGEMVLFSDEVASGIASLYRRRLDHFGTVFEQNETVAIQTLDAFCRAREIERIDFLKLDVEGHEFSVLQGAKNLIEAKAIRFIQFEFGGCNIDSRTYFQDFFYLLNDRYKMFRVLKKGLHPISKYSELDECFVTTNYFAEARE